jgi:hypothetical protein
MLADSGGFVTARCEFNLLEIVCTPVMQKGGPQMIQHSFMSTG